MNTDEPVEANMSFHLLNKRFRQSLYAVLTCTTALMSMGTFAEPQMPKVERKNHQLPRQSTAPILDGVLDDAQWQHAIQIELKYENNPGDGIPAPVKTVAYLYEDGQSLHVAIKAYDPDPSKIRAYLRDRDTLWNDDNVGIIIDTFDDERSGFEFFVNPLGAQADMSMTDTNGWNEDDSWDAIWDSAGKIDGEGFVVEMSIPFRALRFPQTGEALTWNIALWRNYPRDTRHQISNYKPDRDSECSLCLFDKITGFKNIEAGKNFQLTPTLTSSRRDSKATDAIDWESGSFDMEGGLDLRWGITQDMVFNATINPDFSQIEADSAQLDINNTFSLFFPERRPFFLDGASYFDTQRFNLVHTRNIADPDYGTKLTGKTGAHSYGVMVANDNQTTFLVPESQGSGIAKLQNVEQVFDENGVQQDDRYDDIGSDVMIARYKMDIGERNTMGAIMTSRRGDDYSNSVASVDGSYWLSKEDNINYQLAYSQTDNSILLQNEDSNQYDYALLPTQSDHAASIGYSHNTRDYNLNASYTNIGEDFRADLGFMSQVGYEKVVLGGRQTWYGEEGDTFTRWGYFGDWDKSYNADGEVLEEEIELHGNLQGPMQLYSNFGVVARKKLYDENYYDETLARFYAGINPASGIRIQAYGHFGDAIDYANSQIGESFNLGGSLTWQIGTHLQFRGSFETDKMDVTGGQLYSAQQSDIRLTYQFDMRSYVRLVVQYTDITRDESLYLDTDPEDIDARSKYLSTQLLYSYKINPQTLVFLGYADQGLQDDNLSKIMRTDRTVFAKFSYAWQM